MELLNYFLRSGSLGTVAVVPPSSASGQLVSEPTDVPTKGEQTRAAILAAAIERFFAPVPADIRLGGDRAFYSPGADYIQLPHPNVFNTEDGFVATKAHELGHWSGHASRLAREFGKRFGDKAYSFEELVAEQVSARICYELGLPADLHESHASYVSHWMKLWRGEHNFINREVSIM